MAAKLEDNKSVERELTVTLTDMDGTERAVVAELMSDGTVKLRLKGMKRTVTVDLLGALDLGRDGDVPVVAKTEQNMTAQKRKLSEHLRGK